MQLPLVIAHRGASRDAPENTLAAFQLAWAQGADAIETDLRLTADGTIVAFHDADGRRLLGDPRPIRDCTREELPADVPSLAEVLALLPRDKRLVLELKEALGPALPRALAAAPQDRITLIAFDPEEIAAAKRTLPACRALWLHDAGFRASPTYGRQLAARVRELGVDGINLRYRRLLNSRLLAPLREEGRTIFSYTLNKRSEILDAWLLGLDGVTTDCPSDARHWLGISA